MRYTQLLPIAGAATALANPIVPRKECAANDDSYDFVSVDLHEENIRDKIPDKLRLSSAAEQPVWRWRLASVSSCLTNASW